MWEIERWAYATSKTILALVQKLWPTKIMLQGHGFSSRSEMEPEPEVEPYLTRNYKFELQLTLCRLRRFGRGASRGARTRPEKLGPLRSRRSSGSWRRLRRLRRRTRSRSCRSWRREKTSFFEDRNSYGFEPTTSVSRGMCSTAVLQPQPLIEKLYNPRYPLSLMYLRPRALIPILLFQVLIKDTKSLQNYYINPQLFFQSTT